MKKTYQKPASEAMHLGLRGDVLVSIGLGSGNADPNKDVLSKGERDWEESTNFWGD